MTIALSARITGSGIAGIEAAILNQLTPRFMQAADTAGQVGTTRMAATAPKPRFRGDSPGKRSRSLSDSSAYIYAVTSAGPGRAGVEFSVNGDPNYMKKFFATNFGSSAHPIDAVNAKRLVFWGTNDYTGQRIATPHVNHPGTKNPVPYYVTAAEFATRVMLALL